jgi:hypothetical protein
MTKLAGECPCFYTVVHSRELPAALLVTKP